MSQPKRRREACRLPPSDALGTALWLVAQGLWAVAITPPEDDRSPNPGKAPIGRGWGTRRLSTRALFAIFGRQPRAGVGVVLGPASGVVDLEVDDPELAGPLLGELFPDGPPPTMGWSSRRGEHRLYRWDDRLSAARSAVVHLAGGALELRLGAGGKQVAAVCPPSPRADGTPRRWNGIWEIAPCPEVLVDVVARSATPPPARPSPGRPRKVRGAAPGRYGIAALEREAALVRSAGPGTRNEALNRAAFCLGQLVASGAIDRAWSRRSWPVPRSRRGSASGRLSGRFGAESRPVCRTRVGPGRVIKVNLEPPGPPTQSDPPPGTTLSARETLNLPPRGNNGLAVHRIQLPPYSEDNLLVSAVCHKTAHPKRPCRRTAGRCPAEARPTHRMEGHHDQGRARTGGRDRPGGGRDDRGPARREARVGQAAGGAGDRREAGRQGDERRRRSR